MKFLSAWEMGAGLGHIDRMLLVATELRARGHSVSLALRDLSRADARVHPAGFPTSQAPVWLPRMAKPPQLGNYTSVLAAAGWLDAEGLAGLVRGWWRLFELEQPDAVLLDHAPTALLAAQLAGLRCIAVGNSFEMPPVAEVFPPMAWWNPTQDAACAGWDAALLAPLNAALKRLGHPPWPRLTQLFDPAQRLLLQLPSLCHYAGYGSDVRFCGPAYAPRSGDAPDWPQVGKGPRVFAYLNATSSGFSELLAAFRRSEARVLLYAKGLGAPARLQLRHEGLNIAAGPVALDAAVADADIVVSHASIGTVSAAALAGKPQLGLPQHMEQWMQGQRLAQLGIGRCASPEPKPGELTGVWQALLRELPRHLEAARTLQARAAGEHPDRTAVRTADAIG